MFTFLAPQVLCNIYMPLGPSINISCFPNMVLEPRFRSPDAATRPYDPTFFFFLSIDLFWVDLVFSRRSQAVWAHTTKHLPSSRRYTRSSPSRRRADLFPGRHCRSRPSSRRPHQSAAAAALASPPPSSTPTAGSSLLHFGSALLLLQIGWWRCILG